MKLCGTISVMSEYYTKPILAAADILQIHFSFSNVPIWMFIFEASIITGLYSPSVVGV